MSKSDMALPSKWLLNSLASTNFKNRVVASVVDMLPSVHMFQPRKCYIGFDEILFVTQYFSHALFTSGV
jgi:hypothetical protein